MTDAQGSLVLLLSFLLTFVCYRVAQALVRKQPAPYPPGPPPKPIIGNALDLPFRKSWLKYLGWSKELHSDIIHLSALNTHMTIIHTLEDAVELLEKRSANYSSRPVIPIAKFLGMQNMTSMLPYGNLLRKHRRLLEGSLKKESLHSHHDIFSKKVHQLLEQLLDDPARFQEHCKLLGAAVTMAAAFGYDVVPGKKDEFVEAAEFASNTLVEMLVPGRTLLLLFGFLGHIPSWVPGASTQKICARSREAISLYRDGPFQYVKDKMAIGTSKDCMLSRVLERQSEGEALHNDEEPLKDIMATLYLGGVSTMQSAQISFILAMTLHPHEQARAQEEIDRVVGSDRLPTYSDRPSLPYVEALYREVCRWRPVAPLGAPHSTLSDDVYKGLYIPKGSYVFPNVWAISRNRDVYPEPESFRPERFFKADGKLNDDTMAYAFGFGRRICPGIHMADKVIWLMIVSTLATFKMFKVKDENGKEVEIDADAYSNALISIPPSFKCSIVPRTSQARVLIMNAASVSLN